MLQDRFQVLVRRIQWIFFAFSPSCAAFTIYLSIFQTVSKTFGRILGFLSFLRVDSSSVCLHFQTVFNILFGNDEFTKRFHKKFNYDPDAEASSWNEHNERVVKYVASTQAPKMIAKVAGRLLL